MSQRPLWIIEDSDEDYEMLVVILQDLGVQIPLRRFDDGMGALKELKSTTDFPKLILLDLNLPEMDGKEFLTLTKSDPRLRKIPVIALTTSYNPKDVDACYDLGVNAYVLKPVDLNELKSLMENLCRFWLRANLYPDVLC